MDHVQVIIMPGIHVQLEGLLNISKFSVRVSREQIGDVVEILRAIPPSQVAEMQGEIRKVRPIDRWMDGWIDMCMHDPQCMIE